MLAFSLSHGVGLSVWVIAFQAYWATWLHGTFPIVTVQIWIDPTAIDLDHMTLGATGLIVGGIFELIAEGRRNSKIAQLMAAGFRPATRRAPIAFICAWLASRRPAASRKGTLLGTELVRGTSLYLSESDLNHHCLILGTTGKGKTTTLTNLIEAAAERRQATVYLDGKGDEAFADVVRKIAARFGRPFYIFNALSIEKSCAYNPLAAGDYTSKADRVMNLRKWTEPHHESLASTYLQTAFKILDSVQAVIDIVQASKALTITHLLGLLRRKGFSDSQKQALANEISEQEVAERTSIDSLRSDIRYIANSSLGVLFDTVQAKKDGRPILNLEQARREGAVVYFLMPPLLFQKAAPKISQLIINDLKAVTATSRSTFKMFFDESTFSTQAALNLVNMGRTFGVAATFSTQGLADFHAGAPELGEAFVRQVIASVNVYIRQSNRPHHRRRHNRQRPRQALSMRIPRRPDHRGF
jgi:hypothetical protein